MLKELAKQNKLNITIKHSDIDGYYVLLNGETFLECMGKKDIETMTIKEIVDLMKQIDMI